MNWIVALPFTAEDYNSLLTITCKFIKRIFLVSEMNTWNAVKWAEVTITTLVEHDWNISRAIISDRDSKFMSEFWIAVFIKMNVFLLISTAYHPQTNGQSKRTNQTIEIALRFHVTAHSEENWNEVLPYLQAESNNVKQLFTDFTPNELAYDFKVNDPLEMLADLFPQDYQRLRQIKREDAEVVMAFASVVSKARYDQNHRAIVNVIQPRFMIYLRLHQGYTISGLANKKLSNQRVGPFKIIEAVNKSKQAFRLELPPVMKIHSVIFIAQLESATPPPDSYDRNPVLDPSIVLNEHANTDALFYEIERLVDKRIIRDKAHYLVKWKNCGHQHNVWYFIDNLQDAADLIAEYEAIAPRRSIRRRIRLPVPTVRVPRRRIATSTAVQAPQRQGIQVRIPTRSVRRG